LCVIPLCDFAYLNDCIKGTVLELKEASYLPAGNTVSFSIRGRLANISISWPYDLII
jgi:hypothetical protein